MLPRHPRFAHVDYGVCCPKRPRSACVLIVYQSVRPDIIFVSFCFALFQEANSARLAFCATGMRCI